MDQPLFFLAASNPLLFVYELFAAQDIFISG
jgi:hypothetical protein